MTAKKGVIILGLILLIIFLSISTRVNITSLVVHVFDSFATSDVLEVSVGVSRDSTPPDVIIDSPTNASYTTGAIDVNYTALDLESGLGATWYNLNGGENTTITDNITLTLPNGDYTIYIFANDSVGNENGTESVSFSVNVPKTINVIYTRYDYTMTNFSAMNDEELANITNLTLEIMSYGKIRYSENINISEDTDLDTHADISFNNIYINGNVLPNFNKPATLWIYGLTFTNSRILKDGSVCPDAICTKVGYSGGTLEFTVTGFSNYSSEETPTAEAPPGAPGAGEGGGGGRAGRAIQEVSDFKLDKSLVKVYLTPGDTKEDSLKITNTGNTDIDVNMRLNSVNGIKDFLIIREDSFKLKTGEEKSVKLIFIAPELQEPGIYTGQILIRSGAVTKTVDVVIEIESKMALFDVIVEIPPQFKSVQPGESVLAKISLYNLGLIKRADVLVEYTVKDFQNNVIVTQKRSLAVETQASLIGELQIPTYLKEGDYVFYTQVKYDDSIAIGSDEFKVVEKPLEKPGINIYWIISIAIVLFIIANLVLYYKIKKILKQQHRSIKSKKKSVETKVEREKQILEEKLPKEKGELKNLVDHIRSNLK